MSRTKAVNIYIWLDGTWKPVDGITELAFEMPILKQLFVCYDMAVLSSAAIECALSIAKAVL